MTNFPAADPDDRHLGDPPFDDEQVLMALERAVCSAQGCLEAADCMHFLTSARSVDAELVFSCGVHGEDWMYPVTYDQVRDDGWIAHWRRQLGVKPWRGDLLVEGYVRDLYEAPPALSDD